MVRCCVVALLCCAAFVPEVAAAAGPPSATSPGVTAERRTSPNGTAVYVLRFGAAAARDYRKIAGKWARVGCVQLSSDRIGVGSREAATRTLRVPRRRAALRLETGSKLRADYCYVRTGGGLVLNVALSRRGRTYYDEGLAFVTLLWVTVFAPGKAGEPASIADVVAAGGGQIVALPGPDAAPPVDLAGYWTDGERALFASTTRAGRRLFMEFGPGDVVRTNVFGVLGPAGGDDQCADDAPVSSREGSDSCTFDALGFL